MLKWLVTRNPGTDEPGQSTDRYFVHSVSGYLGNSELPPTVNLSLDNSTAIIQQHLLPSVYYRRTQQPNDRLLNNIIAGIGDSENPGSPRTNHLHSKNLSLPNEHRQGKHYHYAVSDILVANEAQIQAAMAAPNFLSSEVVQDKRHAGFSSSPPSTSADAPQESHVSQKLWSHPAEAQMLVGSEHFLMTALPASELHHLPASELHHLPASELHHLPASELRHLTHERKVLSAAITDDPLATLSGRRHKRMHEEIYAVSRLNPLFRDEGLPAHPDLPRLRDPASRNVLQNSSIDASTNVHDMKRVRNDGHPSEENKAAKDVIRTPDSPPTDHNSVRSSGYGSKENDSASDISEHSGEESDNESNNDVIDNITNNRGHRKRKKKIDNENHLLTTKTGVKSGVLEQSGVNGSEFLSAENLFINSMKLEENSTLLPTVSQLRRSFEDLATKNNAKLCDSVNNLPLDYHRNPKYVESIQVGVRRAKSLEIVKEDETLTNSEHHAKAAIPSPIWPKVSHITETLERQASRISSRRLTDADRLRRSSSLDIRPKGQVLRFNPLVSVVTQDSRYVTAISVSPRRSNQTTTFNIASTNEQITYFNEELESNKNLDDFAPGDDRLTRYFNSSLSNRGYLGSTEYPIMSLQPDSLVTEDTLKMMTYPEYTGNSGALSSPILPSNEKHNDLSQVMYTRGLYATLNRNALLQNNNLMNAPFKTRRDKRSRAHSHRTSHDGSNTRVKKKGMDTVRNLWEKSGLKLNGRKLLVNIESEADENQEIAEQNHSINEWYEYGSSERDSSHYEYVSDVDALDDEEFIPSLPRRRNPSNDDKSLSSKSASSRNRPMIAPNSENITHLIESKQSSFQERRRKSIENFAMDNLAFTYDNGDRSNPYHINYRASNHVQGQSRTEIYNKIKVHKSMSGKSSILKNTDSIIGPMYHSGKDGSGKTDQLVDRNENEYSELKEIVIDANSLARHIEPQGNNYSTRESHETTKEGSLSKTSTSAWITSSFGARGSLQKTGQGISKTRDPHPNLDDRVSEAVTQIKPDKNLGPANMSSSLHPVPALEISRETSTIDSSGGSASAPSVYNVSDQPEENGMTMQPNHTAVNIDTVDDHLNEGLFWNIVRFLQSRRDSGNITQNQASNETQKPAAEKRYEDYKKSAKNNYARKLSPHPNSGAQNCRVGGALCADFTLDGAAAREQHRRSRAAKRRKKLCRTISALLALLVFVAVVVAVSWYITGGRRVFGPM